MSRSTRTYTVMSVTARTFAEIKDKMLEAGYEEQIENGDKTLDMIGIALEVEEEDA